MASEIVRTLFGMKLWGEEMIEQRGTCHKESGRGKIRRRRNRFLHELNDHPLLIERCDPALRRRFSAKEPHGKWRRVCTVELDKFGEVRVGKVIGIENEELLAVGHKVTVSEDRPSTPEQLRLHHGMNAHAPSILRQMTPHDIGEMMEVDEEISDTVCLKEIEPPIEQGASGNRNEAFRKMIGNRA